MSSYTEGQVHQLMERFEKEGIMAGELTKLGQFKDYPGLVGVLNGTHEIKMIEDVIDLAKLPRLQRDGAKLLRHEGSCKGKQVVKLKMSDNNLYLDDQKIELFLSKEQQNDSVVGNVLCEELEKRGGNLNSNVLDYLIAHPELWPESWKTDTKGNTINVYFWGSTFRDVEKGRQFVRGAFWRDGSVIAFCDWLGNRWCWNRPAASLAS